MHSRLRRLAAAIALTGMISILPLAAAQKQDAADPGSANSIYQQRDSWVESMLETRKALREYWAGLGFKPRVSPLVRGGDEPVDLSVELNGARRLVLVVEGGPDGLSNDHAFWGDPRLVRADGTAVWLSTLEPESVRVGWDELRVGRSYNAPLQAAGRSFEKGLYAHANSQLEYRLDEAFERFEALGAVASPAGRGSVRFRVQAAPSVVGDVWKRMRTDFPEECADMTVYAGDLDPVLWFSQEKGTAMEIAMVRNALAPAGAIGENMIADLAAQQSPGRAAASIDDPVWLQTFLSAVKTHDLWRDAHLRMAQTHPDFRLVCGAGALHLAPLHERLDLLADEQPGQQERIRNLRKEVASIERDLSGIEHILLRDALSGSPDWNGVDEPPDGALTRTPALVEKALAAAARIDALRGWPTVRADARRSAVTFEKLPSAPTEIWRRLPAHPPAPAWPPPATSNFSVSLRQLSNTVTYDRARHAVAVDGRIFFGSSADDAVRAIDAHTGEDLWRFTTEGPVRIPPVVYRNVVYAGSDDGSLYALSANSGKLVWKRPLGPDRRRLPGNGRMISRWPLRCGLVAGPDRLYGAAGLFPSQGAWLFAADLATGELALNTPIDVSPQGFMLASRKRLFLPTGRTPFAAFDRKTGEALGAFGANNSWGEDLPGGTLAIVADDTLATFRSEDGRVNTYDLESRERIVTTHAVGLVIHGPMAYTQTETTITALDRAEYINLQKRQRIITAIPVEERTDWHKKRLGEITTRMERCVRWQTACNAPHALIAAGDALIAGGDDEIVGFDARSGERIWRAACDGRAEGLAVHQGRLYVSTDSGTLHCFGPAEDAPAFAPEVGPGARGVVATDAGADDVRDSVRELLERTGLDQGYALLPRAGDAGAHMAEALADASRLQVILRTEDQRRARDARDRLHDLGLNGVRVSVHEGGAESLPYPAYFANAVLLDAPENGGAPATPADEIFRVLRPIDGALCVRAPGGDPEATARALQAWLATGDGALSPWRRVGESPWWVTRRAALEGAGEWVHQYAEPGASACSGDQLVHGEMEIHWFGEPGPRSAPDRHHHNVAPLSKDGRLFIPSYGVIHAADIYNGTLLWRAQAPRATRFGAFLDCGGMAVDEDFLYVAAGPDCLVFDVADGRRAATRPLPAAADGSPREWGLLARTGDLIVGSSQRPGASYSDIELRGGSRFYGQSMQVVTSLGVFAMEADSNRVLWQYAGKGAIPNTSLAVADGRVFFLETTSEAAVQDFDGRTPAPEMFAAGEAFLVALDVRTGDEVFRRRIDASKFQQASYINAVDGVVLVSAGRIVSPKAHYVALAFRASDGEPLWNIDQDTGLPDNGGHGELNRHPTIVGGKAYTWPYAYDLQTGERDPEWRMDRSGHGCGGVSASAHSLFWRGGNPWMADLGGKGVFRRLTQVTRPGCWINMLPAGGLLLVPEASSGCTCGFSIQTSLAFMPVAKPEARTAAR